MPIWSHGPVAVNEATGNVVLSVPTPSYPTTTGSLGFSLTYNSQGGAGTGGVGTGWVLSTGDADPPAKVHDNAMDTYPAPTAEVDSTDGSLELYQQVGGSNTYLPLQEDGSQLTRLVSGSNTSWTLIEGDGSSYTFGTENSSGDATLTSDEIPQPGQNGQLSYMYSSGKIASVSYKETSQSTSSETLTFNWSCTGYLFCVTGPDVSGGYPKWGYAATDSSNPNSITAVDEITAGASVHHLMALTWNATSHQLTTIQNADDLDPNDSSPFYNTGHKLSLSYDSASPRRLTCVVDGPIHDESTVTLTSSMCGLSAGTYSDSIWSFNYSPTCPSLQTEAVSHTVAQGTSVGCTTLTNPDQQPSGPGITVLYDTFNRPLEYDDARLGSGHERISLSQYNAQNQIAWNEDPDGNPTDYSYDPVSNLLTSVTGPEPAGGTLRPVTSYRYDEQTIGTLSTPGNALTGLAGTYWPNTETMTGLPITRENDPASGGSTFGLSSWPSVLSTDTGGFSAQWTGQITVAESGDYTFTTASHDSVHSIDDGTSLIVGGIDALENMASPVSPANSQLVYLTAGTKYQVTLDYAHSWAGTRGASLSLQWACSDCTPAISQQTVPVSDLFPGWGNQTSVVSPSGRIAFQHFLNQASDQPDYSLVQVGSSNLITSYLYDSLGRTTTKYMPKANASATLDSTTGNLTSTPDTNYETDYTYYPDHTTGTTGYAAPPSACGGGTAVNQYGQLKQTSVPNSGLATITTVYQSAGLPKATTNGKGTSCLTYDARSRLTSQTPNGDQTHPVTYTYDPNNTALTTSQNGKTVTTYYDEAGRLSDTVDASAAEANFSYDEDGNTLDRIANTVALSGTSCPSSTDYCTTYSYDGADELSTETDAAGNSWSFFYDNRGNLRGTQHPNGTFSWTDTDPAGDTTDVYNHHGTISSTTTPTTVPSDSNPLADYTWTYVDGSHYYQDGKKLTEARTSGSTTQNTSYTYDNAGRLSQVLLPTGTCRNYSYDLDSNRTQIQESPTGCGGTFTTTATYTYNRSTTPGIDQLTSVTAGSTTNYGYDSDGRTTSQGTTGYTWNGLDQFATATVGSNTVTYTYDPTGALMTRASSAPSTTTNYSLGDLFETNGSGTITTSYTDGPAGDLASYNGPPTSASTVTSLYYDGHGNLAAEADNSGTQTANHTYDPFGAPLDSVPTNTTAHRFVGRWDKQYDTTTALVVMGARPYDPNTGRFLAVDPIPGGSLNNYDYASQDPINNYDLSGQREGGWEQYDLSTGELSYEEMEFRAWQDAVARDYEEGEACAVCHGGESRETKRGGPLLRARAWGRANFPASTRFTDRFIDGYNRTPHGFPPKVQILIGLLHAFFDLFRRS